MLLRDTYLNQIGENMEFQVFGLTYPDEVVISVSYIDTKNSSLTPVTYQASSDLTSAVAAEKLMETLVDSIGMFFDSFFTQASDQEDIYIPRWQEEKYKKIALYYRVTRENVALSFMADQLLKDNE